jgi:uncharacterized membrane protein YbaN (DUF454 family)
MDSQLEDRSVGTGQKSGWLRKATGWGLLLAGVAGCILPVIPGIPLVIAGLLILARDYAWAKAALRRTKRWAVKIRRRARSRGKTPGEGSAARKGI